MIERELSLQELLEQALEALTDFIIERGDLAGCERVEDASVLVYDALARVHPAVAIDRAELHGSIDEDTAVELRTALRARAAGVNGTNRVCARYEVPFDHCGCARCGHSLGEHVPPQASR